jgi:putative transcriptional regulator
MLDLDKILNIRPTKVKPTRGRVLISNPFLSDYFFRRAVVLLIDHGEDGTLGLIINKPLVMKLPELTSIFPLATSHVFLGGPVKTDGIFFIHTYGTRVPDSIEVMPGLYWGGDMQTLDLLIRANPQEAQEKIRFYLGYSGWVSGQLRDELVNRSWIITQITSHEVISPAVEQLWYQKVRAMGKDFEPWLNFPPDPSFN